MPPNYEQYAHAEVRRNSVVVEIPPQLETAA